MTRNWGIVLDFPSSNSTIMTTLQSTTTTKKLSLHSLPTEILLEIADHLRSELKTDPLAFTSTLAVRWTCRRLHDIVPSARILPILESSSRHEKSAACKVRLEALIEMETWPQYSSSRIPGGACSNHLDTALPGLEDEDGKDFLAKLPSQSRHACGVCLELRRTQEFHESQVMSKGGRQKQPRPAVVGSPLDREILFPHNRLCIRCAMGMGLYRPEASIRFIRNPDDYIFTVEGCQKLQIAINSGLTSEERCTEATQPTRDLQCAAKKVTVKPASALELCTGFVCKRCLRFSEVPNTGALGRKNHEEGPLHNKEFLRRTCRSCLEYRPPGHLSISNLKM